MFDRIKRTRAVARRMKKVGHNHVVSGLRDADESARVGHMELESGVSVRRVIVGLELRHNFNDLRHEFDPIAFQIGMQAGCAESDARSQAQKERPFWGGVEEQGDVGMTILCFGRGGAAHLKAVVDTERFISSRIFENSDGGHGALAIIGQLASERNRNHLEIRRQYQAQNDW